MTRIKLTDEAREAERPTFEDRAFQQRYIMSIRKIGDGPFALQSMRCPTKADFVKRGPDGQYEDATLSAMWWAWCAALEEQRPAQESK